MTLEEAEAAVHDMLAGNALATRVIASLSKSSSMAKKRAYRDGGRRACAADGYQPGSQSVGDKDTGPNTGGMGAYSPAR